MAGGISFGGSAASLSPSTGPSQSVTGGSAYSIRSRYPGSPCTTGDGKPGTYDERLKCVATAAAAPQQFFSPGSISAPAGTSAAPTAVKPTAPTAPQIDKPREIGGSIPELAALGSDYQAHLRNLEAGAGYSMDVLTGAQRNQTEAQIKQARDAAAAQGVPFDEARMRSELQRGVYSAQAQEKLGREKLLTDAYGQAPGIIGADEAARESRWKIGSDNDISMNAARAGIYGTQAGIYGSQAGMYNTEVNAANAANQALLDFISRIYSGMFNVMGGSMSQNYTYGG